jgi:hypothetical protein
MYSKSVNYILNCNDQKECNDVKTGNWPRFDKRVWQIVVGITSYGIKRNYLPFDNISNKNNNISKGESDMLNGGTDNRILEESFPFELQVWMV